MYLLPVLVTGILLFFSSFSFTQPKNQTLPLSRGKNTFFMELNTGYYYTDSNYTNNFKSQSLRQTLGLSNYRHTPFFQYMNMDLSLGYTFTDWFEIEAFSSGFWFAQSGDGNRLRFSSPQIKRAGAAFRSQQDIDSFGFIPEFSISFPFFPVNPSFTEKPVIDDGSIHFTPGIWLYGSVSDIFYPFVYGGFKLRTKSLSSLLQWKLGAMLRSRIAEIGAYTYGFWSVVRDRSSSQVGDRFNLLKEANAGSLNFFSANPGVIGFLGWLGWRFPVVTVRLSGDIDINGTNYSKGYSFLASLIFEIKTTRTKKIDSIFDEDSKEEKDFVPQMTEDEEAVNKEIFENTVEDTRIQEEAEKILRETEKMEETKIEESHVQESYEESQEEETQEVQEVDSKPKAEQPEPLNPNEAEE